MRVREERTAVGETGLHNVWVWRLIAGRLLVAGLLFGVSVLWTSGLAPGAQEARRLGSALPFAFVVLGSSAAYALALRFTRIPLRAQAGAQFALDALLVTWLVWVTGNLYSPYTALYIVVISAASIFLGARGALSDGGRVRDALHGDDARADAPVGSAAGRGLTAASLAEVAQATGLNVVAFLVVGLLAARLAVRQTLSEVQMREATHALVSLRALHERIVESIRSGVITTDLERRVYTVNRAAEEMTGYAAADLRGQDVSILFGDMASRIDESLRSAAEGHTSPRYESECLTPEGFLIKLGYNISPLSSEGGRDDGARHHLPGFDRHPLDGGDLAAAGASVGRGPRRRRHRARDTEPSGGDARLDTGLRSELEADAPQRELMDIVLSESDRLNRIITDFLTYARPRKFSLAETDLREPLRETFALLRHSPELLDGHRLEEDLPDEPAAGVGRRGGRPAGLLEPHAQRPEGDARRRDAARRDAAHGAGQRPHHLHRHGARHDARAGRATLRALLLLDDRRDGPRPLHRLPDNPRPRWYNQRPQPRGARDDHHDRTACQTELGSR